MTSNPDLAETVPGPDTETRVETLREGLIENLRGLGALRTSRVESAVRAVPRHLFVPEDDLENAYAPERALITKRDDQGVAVSSVSAARIQTFMLEQADIRPGMRVLEIGSGGLNAAMIAELTGPDGMVVTVDIDPDVIDRARRLLTEAGYGHVQALAADGRDGTPEQGPFDRIVVTVEAADIAPAWLDQLTGDGRIVVPLRLRGLTRSFAFQREGGRLVSDGYELCGFVPMRGIGAHPQRLLVLHDDDEARVGLRVDDPNVAADEDRLSTALKQAATRVWSEVTIGRGEPYDDVDLWLGTAADRFAALAATRQARDTGVVDNWSAVGLGAILDSDGTSFAYVALRPISSERERFEFGAVAHGPRAEQLAEHLNHLVRQWDDSHRDSHAVVTAWPAGTPDSQLPPDRVVDRAASRFTISWPETGG